MWFSLVASFTVRYVMLLSLLGAVLYPVITSKQSKTAPLRGAFLGVLLSLCIGYFMPSGMSSTQKVALTPMRIQTNGDQFNYSILMLDEGKHVVKTDLTPANSTLTINDHLAANEVRVNRCYSTFNQQWMWAIGIRFPSTSYEIEVPTQMANQFTTAATNGTVVLYTNEQIIQPAVAVAK